MKRQRGNILFLILLAVVLFAALSYAVTGQREQVGNGMSKEAADAAAAEITGWLPTVDTAVQRLKLIKGYRDDQLDFDDTNNYQFDGTRRYLDNTNCVTTDCMVFQPNGGGAISLGFQKYASTAFKPTVGAGPGSRDILLYKVQDMGTTANDIVLQILGIKIEICKAINRKEGLSDCPTIGGGGGLYVGYYSDMSTRMDLNANPLNGPESKGRYTVCQCASSVDGDYGIVQHVVVAR